MLFLTAVLSLVSLVSALPSFPPSCKTNRLTAYETVTGPVAINTSPLDPYENIKLSAVNETAWEYYYFDSVSSDGAAGVAITFYRDPSLSFLGLGVLRVELDAVWSNGTKFSTTFFVNESTVSTCPGETRGLWNTTSEGIEFSFSISEDLRAEIFVQGPDVTGKWSIESFTPPRTPDGVIYPSPKASVSLAPLLYWNEAIPAGRVHTSLILAGTPFSLTGIGGHDRNFAAYIWDNIAEHWYWIRLVTGPYAAVLWVFTSAVDGKTYTSAFLSEAGVEIFATENGVASQNEDYATLGLTYGGEVHGSFADQSTGYVIEFVGNGCGKSWKFEVEHVNIAFKAPLDSNDEYSRFANTASGGQVGEQVWKGVANSEQNVIKVVQPLV